MKKVTLILIFVLVLVLSTAGIASAITDGELDGEEHSHVVLILMEVDGEPAYRCSGTMLTPTYVLTAGHCAGAPGEFSGIRIFTESDVQGGIGTTNNYPYAGPNSVEAVRWAAHPDYPNYPFYFNDVGMIELEEPGFDPGVFGELPTVDSLDQYKTQRGHNDLYFTSVGYGLQLIVDNPVWGPVHYQGDRTRYVANPHLIQINTPGFTGDFSLLLSNNHSTGGTCFGDSGGPNFLGDTNTVAGVTSFGLNGNCAGTGGVFRMDRQNVQDFVNDFMNP